MKILGATDSALWKTAIGSLVLAMLVVARPALAELGGDEASVQADQAQMQAIRHVAAAEGYNVHEMRTAAGTVVREYVSPGGKVFAVSWEGQAIPDLHQLLGSYFEQLQKAQVNRRGHGPLMIREPGLVLFSGGHMRAFIGKAYAPDLVPQGVRPESIR